MALPTAPARLSRMLTLNEVCELLGVHRTTVYRMIERGDFPPGVLVTRGARRWSSDVVEEWIESRPIYAA